MPAPSEPALPPPRGGLSHPGERPWRTRPSDSPPSRSFAADLKAGKPPTPPPRIKSGTRLLREWQGTVHEVIVLDEGVHYRGKAWPSLSAVAREITGARWSGPRFFGLKTGGESRGRA
ncbi:MAG: DUF2924 domain-containing protein [Candidatus Eisenbacteria bacterium]|uniref:DUF2924 domain-containing protein n=1 Tax=Eiseniibacteriota bacterium TaxID=2212470 RepID=A0A956NHF1_UNCEI|nr:DUF2924 domain-containing protein [Candidatus Eisenbacteria bacterium]